MKMLGKIVKFVLWTLAVVVAIVLLLPLWVGPVAKYAANTAVPKTTGTPFHIGEFSLNQYTGRLRIGDVQVQNPERFFKASEKKAKGAAEVKGEGILGTVAAHAGNALAAAGDAANAALDAVSSSETNAVSLGLLDVSFSTLSALTDTIRIPEIKIENLYFYGDMTFSNIREIADNASKGGEEAKAEEKKTEAEEKKPEDGEGKKVVIDRVFITGTKLQWGHVAVNLPDIEIKDIGKDSGGADRKAAFDKIVAGICDAADKACAGAGSALKVALEGASAAADAVSGAINAAGGAAGTAVDTAKDAAGAAVNTAKDAAGAAAGAAKDAAGAAVDTAKEAAGAAKEAIGGAVDSVKNLFK